MCSAVLEKDRQALYGSRSAYTETDSYFLYAEGPPQCKWCLRNVCLHTVGRIFALPALLGSGPRMHTLTNPQNKPRANLNL